MRIERDQIKAAVAMIVLVIGFIAFIGVPTWRKSAELTREIDAVRRDAASRRSSADRLPEIGRAVLELRKQVDAADRVLPPEDEMADFVRKLTGRLQALSVRNHEIRTANVTRGELYGVTPFAIEFQATFASAWEFLASIEASSRLTRVTRVDLRVIDPSGDGAAVGARIDVDAYFSPVTEMTP